SATCVCFCITYLSWEGQGYLLPVLAVTLLLMYPGRWSWLRAPHLWIGLVAVASIVLIQLSLRSMGAPRYRSLGIPFPAMTPSLYFLNPESDPFYYVNLTLRTEPHFLLSILCIVGVLFVWRHLAIPHSLLPFTPLPLPFPPFPPLPSPPSPPPPPRHPHPHTPHS